MHLLLCTLDFCIMIRLMKEFHIKTKRKLNKMGELFQFPYFSDGKTKAWRKSDCPKNRGPQDQHQGYNSLSWLLVHSALWLSHAFCMPCTLFGWPYIKKKKKKIQKERQLFLEEEMTTHSSILAWEIPWTEEPGGLQSMGWQRVRNDWCTNTFIFTFVKLKAKPEGKTAGKN